MLPLWLRKLLIRSRLAGFLPAARRLSDGGTSFLRYYSDRVLAAPVEELLDPAFCPGPVGPGVLDLNRAVPQFDPALGRTRLDSHGGAAESSRGSAILRNAIADHHIRLDGREVDPERELLVAHGASGAFASVLDAFVNRSDSVVLFDPCSPLFHLGAKSRRARIRWVPTWTEHGRLRFPRGAFDRAVRGAKLLVLCDPLNPTGACLSTDDLEYIAWFTAGYDVLIYSDESYRRFRYDGRSRSIATMDGANGRTLTGCSFSHGWGLEAARIGWLAGHRHLLQACALASNLSAPWVAPQAQHLAARALGESEESFAPVLERFRSRRGYVVDRLQAMGLESEQPSGGYFVWVSVASLGLDGRTFAERLLRDRQVLVGPGCAFGPSGNSYVRISFAADDGRLREGLTRMAAFVNGLRHPSASGEMEMGNDPETVSTEKLTPQFSRL